MGPVNVVREDPKQAGLLYAGTERSVYFSIDDGRQLAALRQNLPPLDARPGDPRGRPGRRHARTLDLDSRQHRAAARAGAGGAAESAHLFAPPQATRVRWNMFSDTPLPPEEPTGENPPDGAILDYHLARGYRAHVTLEILDRATASWSYGVSPAIRSAPKSVDPTTTLPHPTYWIRPPQSLSEQTLVITGSSGTLRYSPPPRRPATVFDRGRPRWRTPSGPHGPFVPPGGYTVRLTVDGSVAEQPLQVRLDPRVDVDAESLALQTDLSMRCYHGYHRLQQVREAIDLALQGATADTGRAEALNKLRGSRLPGDPDIVYGSIYRSAEGDETVTGLQHKLLFLLNVMQAADARPTSQALRAVSELEGAVDAVLRRWEEIR